MTAKEIIRERKHPIHGYYVFERYQLKDFAKLICKEQRELDAMLYRDIMYEAFGNKKVYMDKDYTKKLTKTVILNTKQPEV